MADEKTFEEKVQAVIEEIRPMLQADGGDCEVAGYDGKKVIMRLKGVCAGCPGAMMTLKNGIEARLKEVVPEVEEVLPEAAGGGCCGG